MSQHPNGTRVRGNWGASFPEDRGAIIGNDGVRGYLVKWDKARPHESSWHVIKEATPGAGSPIGVFLA